MENPQSSEPNQTNDPPQPEALKPRAEDGSPTPEATTKSTTSPEGKKLRRHTYRPSHKATFLSLGVVIAILAINAVVLTFVLKKGGNNDKAANDKVTISQSVLDKLGVNRSSIGEAGVGLTIGPNTAFKNNVDVAGTVNVSGQLTLNNKFVASDAALGQLESGKASVSELNVNGSSSATDLTLRNGLTVDGVTHLQGTVTIEKLLTVNNNLNVKGALAIGGAFSAHALTSTGTLTIGGHVVTSGSTPGVSGAHLGSNGTITISGNDAAGTVSVSLGVGGGGGTVATVTFATKYSATPHVVMSPVGPAGDAYIGSRSTTGFTIVVPDTYGTGAGLAFDFIVEQ